MVKIIKFLGILLFRIQYLKNITTTVLISNNSCSISDFIGIYNSKIINNNITYRRTVFNNDGMFTLDNVIFDNNILGTNGTTIYQMGSVGVIKISSISIANTNLALGRNGTLFYNEWTQLIYLLHLLQTITTILVFIL